MWQYSLTIFKNVYYSNLYSIIKAEMSSEYEKIVARLIREKLEELEYLKKKKDSDESRAKKLTNEIETLETLFDNYNLGMNYFRRSKGGRSGLRE
jgi:hypothetical protein